MGFISKLLFVHVTTNEKRAKKRKESETPFPNQACPGNGKVPSGELNGPF